MWILITEILKWVWDDDFWKSFVLIRNTWLFEEIKWDLENDEEVGEDDTKLREKEIWVKVSFIGVDASGANTTNGGCRSNRN